MPYVGGGGGFNTIYGQTGTFSGGAVSKFTLSSGNATNGMALTEAGVAFALDAKWSIVPSYGFQYVFTSRGSDMAHIVKLGVRYSS